MLVCGALFALQLSTTPRLQREPAPVTVLVARARAARYQQDSLLASYQVVVRQRMSASIGLAHGLGQLPMTRPRLAARFESVARVGWHHTFGAWGEVLGARSVAPIVGEVTPGAENDDEDVALVLPYYPGRDRLWPVTELRDALPEASDWIEHPLDPGADSIYTFSIGDSISFHLPGGRVIALRELRVRPRRPDSRLVVGSLWLDVETGSLVRAAYRPSVAMDLWPFFERDVGRGDRDKVKKFGPFTGIVREVIVEHGLYEGRFWLPRTRLVNAEGTAKGAKVTASIEQTFRYEGVTGLASKSEYHAAAEPPPDIDPRDGRVRRGTWRGVEDRGDCRAHGDSSARWSPDSLLRDDGLSVMYSEGVRFRVLVPCRARDLVNSPELPKSIYADDEALFTDTDLGALRRDVEGALAIDRQAEWQPQPYVLHYGMENGLLRYNRIEGLSAGVMVDRVLGNGYTEGGVVRLGSADLQPNAELYLQRTNMRTDLQATAYRRLVAANDWGNPLGLGASLSALLFARDEGFYYRTAGAEITGVHRGSGDRFAISWRAFGERDDSAVVETQGSVAHGISGRRFIPNIAARAGAYYGGGANAGYSWGSNPNGTRVSGNVRAEGAAGEIAYGRLMVEQTLMRGLTDRVQATLTGAAGAGAGELPAQRLWYLGGTNTVRGHLAGEMAGDAFWLGRAELARGSPVVRPAVFADIGWAGPRAEWNRAPRTIAGVGIGATALDGLVRFDVARGLGDQGRWRMDLYLDVR